MAEAFHQLKHRGSELKKRKQKLPNPKHPDRPHYRNLILQNEWLRANVFDSVGNYLFCQECVKKALKISSQRLARQRSVKRSANTTPLFKMKKSEIEAEKLTAFAVVPAMLDVTSKTWWKIIPSELWLMCIIHTRDTALVVKHQTMQS